jgi:hypothetical protein
MENETRVVQLPDYLVCASCRSTLGSISHHNQPERWKLICNNCGAYKKFLSKKEVHELCFAEAQQENEFNLAMKEINFKLDLIIDHLNIKQ